VRRSWIYVAEIKEEGIDSCTQECKRSHISGKDKEIDSLMESPEEV
jgi:hypothetical protein